MSEAQRFEAFSDLNLPDPLSRALERMGFSVPTPIQAETIPTALTGKDILGIADTGTGKTAAFGIPMINALHHNKRIQGLVLAPTRELAAQIHKVLGQISEGLRFRGTLMVGGESFRKQRALTDRGADYIVATPGRLIDHLKQRTLRLDYVGVLVLDEVDRILDMGFLPQIQEIMQHVPADRQTLVFSATLPGEITALANRYLRNPLTVRIGTQTLTPKAEVKEETIETTHSQKPALLIEQVRKRSGKILVFASTKDRTDVVAKILEREGFRIAKLHGNCTQSERKQALEGFRRGTLPIMVATDLAGRGIDVPDIECVINYDLPNTREDYIHRIGRTARYDRSGTAVNFLTATDIDGYWAISGSKKPVRKVFRTRR